MRSATRCVVCAIVLCSLTAGITGEELDLPRGQKLQRAAQRWELLWDVAPTTYLHYTAAEQRRIDPRQPLPDGAKPIDPALGYVHFLGYEFNQIGEIQRLAAPLVMEEHLFQPAMAMSGDKQKPGGVWTREWLFDNVVGNPKITLSSSYLVKEAETFNGVECAVIIGTHTRVEPAKPELETDLRWLTYTSTTTTWYNVEERRVQASAIELHASLFRPAVTTTPAATECYDWYVRFEFSRDFDSTADRYLHERVESAIDKGVDRLWALRNAEGTWPYGTSKRGGTALTLLTLLMCDVPASDERIKQGFELLKGMEMETTYSVACSLMAYEARYITEAEKRAYLSNPDKPPEFKRAVSPEDREQMELLIAWMRGNQNEVNPFYNYTRNGEGGTERFDFSNTQYALLGLAAALRCEVAIPAGIIKPLVEGVIAYQQPYGPKVKKVVGYKPPTDKRKEGKSTYASKPVEARGWNYATKSKWDKYTEVGDAYGSMTTAGLTCLLVGLDIAQSMDVETFKAEFGNKAVHQEWEKAAQASLDCGLAWLEHWFSVTRNPNKGRSWYLYYMYGLERVMMLAQVRYLGVHNWYNEGASVLVVTQAGDGGWGSAPDTCFALLFLKKGTVPPRRKVTTGSK